MMNTKAIFLTAFVFCTSHHALAQEVKVDVSSTALSVGVEPRRLSVPLYHKKVEIVNPKVKLRAKQPERPVVYTLKNVVFEFDSSQLTRAARLEVKALAGLLKRGHQRYRVVGYTDSLGSSSYNQNLSERRASAVVDLLVQYGLDSTQFFVEGRGAHSPVATNKTAEGRQENRRVEIVPVL